MVIDATTPSPRRRSVTPLDDDLLDDESDESDEHHGIAEEDEDEDLDEYNLEIVQLHHQQPPSKQGKGYRRGKWWPAAKYKPRDTKALFAVDFRIQHLL